MSLVDKTCRACAQGTSPMTEQEAGPMVKEIPGWSLEAEGKAIQRMFNFESYWAGLGFVNAVAWIAQAQKHHPEMELGYKKVRVRYTTDAAGGLTENDFICAAKVSALLS